jgi:hypothetical protein
LFLTLAAAGVVMLKRGLSKQKDQELESIKSQIRAVKQQIQQNRSIVDG